MKYRIKQYIFLNSNYYCNVGLKTEIIFSQKDFEFYKDKVLFIKNKKPYSVQSYSDSDVTIQELNNAKANLLPIVFDVVKKTNGGYIVDYKNIKCFLPTSLFIFGLDAICFKKYPLYVVDINIPKKTAIVSKSPNRIDDEYASVILYKILENIYETKTQIECNKVIVHCNDIVIIKTCSLKFKTQYIGSLDKTEEVKKFYLYGELKEHIMPNSEREGSIIKIKNNDCTVKLDSGWKYTGKVSDIFNNIYESKIGKKNIYIVNQNTLKIKSLVVQNIPKYRKVRILHDFNYCLDSKFNYININIRNKRDRLTYMKNKFVFVNKKNNIVYPKTGGFKYYDFFNLKPIND